MKTLFAFLTLILTTIAVWAQKGQFAGQRNYNPGTVTTISGTINAVEKQVSDKRYGGIHLIVQTSSEKIAVHVGPQWYVEKQSMSLNKGDKIEVEGSKVEMNNDRVIIARKIKKGNETMELRNQDGTPLWSRRGYR